MPACVPQNCHPVFPSSVMCSVFAVKEIINDDISRHIVLKDLAKYAATNECTLKKTFREIFGTSVYQYLLATRMEKAIQLVQTTRLKQKEIAWECGYESLAGFITTFRRYYGISPGKVRKHHYRVPH